ncbi:hypothetical protein ACH4D5_37890 [Streptomyces sp. NPDC018029]|uniref:hypothetical protein n=1 Tax=Streptomyces sp. NPDC018029 TaxID=3365032 RepID=UPI0037B871C6
MDLWQPDPGETLLVRAPVTFATGEAMRVKGMRWFRDTERNDIQGELPDWPEGPTYTVRSGGNSLVRNVVKGGLMTVGVLILGVLTSQGGSFGSNGGPGAGSDTPDERADEVEDFPVMWAGPGTLARTLPWELDPGRMDEKYFTTHAIVTDRRLVIVGLPVHKKNLDLIDDEVLWETPRSNISEVVPRDFKHGTDLKVVFADGSWCRLAVRARQVLARCLANPLNLIPLTSLTSEQRATAEAFAAAQAPDAGPALVSRNACGCYAIRVVKTTSVTSYFGASDRSTVMDADGTELDLMKYHPEDLTS